MKTILRMLAAVSAVVCMVLFAASCSSQSSPKDVASQAMECMKRGDVDKFVDLLYVEEGTDAEEVKRGKAMIKAMYEGKGMAQLEKKQGIKSYEVIDEKMNEEGNRCKVTLKVVYGDGSEKDNETINTIKDKDGKWWLYFSM